MIRRLAVMAAVAGVLLLAGCGESGVVQDKRHHLGQSHIEVYELCLGDSKANCRWVKLSSGTKTEDVDYRNCSVGERYPDCRNLF